MTRNHETYHRLSVSLRKRKREGMAMDENIDIVLGEFNDGKFDFKKELNFFKANRDSFGICVEEGLITKRIGNYLYLTDKGKKVIKRKGWERHLRIKIYYQYLKLFSLLIIPILVLLFVAFQTFAPLLLLNKEDISNKTALEPEQVQLDTSVSTPCIESVTIDSTKTVSY